MSCEFEVGDIVRLRGGHSPQKILEIRRSASSYEYELRCLYVSCMGYEQAEETYARKWRRANDFVLYIEEPQEEKQMSDLYQVKKAIERFGVFLTRNSAGHMVLEMKGENGKVEAFPDGELELVTPYTVRLRGIGAEGTLDLVAEKDVFNKNDILMETTTGNLLRVTDLDTKVRGAQTNSKLRFVRLQTEEVKFGLSE